jgi:hypothetical protein
MHLSCESDQGDSSRFNGRLDVFEDLIVQYTLMPFFSILQSCQSCGCPIPRGKRQSLALMNGRGIEWFINIQENASHDQIVLSMGSSIRFFETGSIS